MSDWDVIVVGSGPSGSVSAGLLATLGYSVLMLEREEHPRPKPCGEFINPGAIAALRRAGFADAIERLEPSRIRGWNLRTWQGDDVHALFANRGTGGRPAHRAGGERLADRAIGGRLANRDTGGRLADPGMRGDLVGWGLPRMRVDAALAQAACDRGATLHERRTVTAVSADSEGVLVESRGGGRRIDRGRFLLAADGLRSMVGRWLGAAGAPGPRRRVSLTAHLAGRGPDPSMGWLRIGGHRTVGLAALDPYGERWNATVVADPRVAGPGIKRGAKAFLLEALEQADIPWERSPQWIAGPWASGPFERPTRSVTGPSWALVGDAAGYFDPLTGQGVHQAVRSAELASAYVHSALEADTAGRGIPDYARQLRRELTPVRRVQRVVASVVESAAWSRAIFPRLQASPESASALIRVTGDWSQSRSLFLPRVWAPLLRPRRRSYPLAVESS